MDYKDIGIKVIRHIRGKMPQTRLNQKMGFKHNQLFKWESGQRRIPWNSFVSICKVRGLSLETILFDQYFFSEKVISAQSFLNYIIGKSDINELSKVLRCSPYRLKGWLTGKREPYLDDILKILDLIEHRLIHLLVALVGESKTQEFGADLTVFLFEKFEAENPIFSAILRMIETKQYRQEKRITVGYFSKQLGISESYELLLLSEATKLGILEFKKGKYFTKINNTDLRSAQLYFAHRAYWYKEAIKKLELRQFTIPEHVFGNLVYSASSRQQGQILERYLSFFNDIRTIINSDEEPEGVYVLNVQMMPIATK